MASFVKKTFLLVFFLICFIHLTTGYTLVPGISVPQNTTVPQRLEIRTFIQDSTRLNILYLALESMQAANTNDFLSFYRISSIHGTGMIWDGDDGGSFSTNYGYCHHFDTLFPPWHRPYLSLYEKTLLDQGTQIVQGFTAGTVKDQHLASLQTWRFPYWDWAMNGSVPDEIGSRSTVSVTKMQNGVLKNVTIHNPWYSYPTNPNDANTRITGNPKKGPYTKETVRNPTVQNKVYVSRPARTNDYMIQASSGLKNSVFQTFSISADYDSFSNQGDGDYSIESPHGTVHVVLGGNNGHMSYVTYAGFDPIFYLHHANVDRLFALWQAMYPDSYVSNKSTDFLNENTELHPFRKTDSQYWTSKLARYTTAFGYTYPELVNCNQQCVIAAVNQLYGPNSSKKKRSLTTESVPYNEYAARVKISNAAAYGSFSINLFFGEPTVNETDYAMDPNYVGSFDVFARIDMPRSHKKIVRGTVSMTAALNKLVGQGSLTDMKEKTVKAYLEANFKWIMTGDKIGDYDLQGLDITIVKARVVPPKDEFALPVWGKFSTVYNVV